MLWVDICLGTKFKGHPFGMALFLWGLCKLKIAKVHPFLVF